MKEQIIKLRSEGLTYNQIVERLGCSQSTISFHCAKDGKAKVAARNQKNRKKDPLRKKVHAFAERKVYQKIYNFNGKAAIKDSKFTKEELLNKIGNNPSCAITGVPIDLSKPETYSLDHIMPRSRGGENSLDNCQIVTRQVNQAKSDLTTEEFVLLCKKVIEHNKG
jgi:CRISPR/Cas system Type II protein with McrA/HNH and RuvC-like nuclease domain